MAAEKQKTKVGEEKKNGISNPASLSADEKKLLKQLESGKSDEKEEKEEIKVKDTKFQFYTAYKYDVDPEIGLIFKNYELISKQKQVAFVLIKKIGSSFLQGKSVASLELPVYLFEPQTYLQFTAATFRTLPLFIPRMAQEKDPLERMKIVVAFFISAMHLSIGQMQPLMSMAGETFQGKMNDVEISAELTNFSPQTCSTVFRGKEVVVNMSRIIDPHTYPNTAKINTKVKDRIFVRKGEPDETEYILKEIPGISIGGLLVGKRTFGFENNIYLKDKKNHLYAHIRFNPEKRGFFEKLFNKTEAIRSDVFKGFITKNHALVKNLTRDAFYSKEILVFIEGQWMEYVKMDGEFYWRIEDENSVGLPKMVSATDLLPSDSSFRPDIQAMLKGDYDAAEKIREAVYASGKKDHELTKSFKKGKQEAIRR